MEAYKIAFEQALQMIDDGKPKDEILHYLIKVAENMAGADTVSSILVLDEEGLLRNGLSPRLPKDYLEAIDKLKPHPDVGTCSAAAATGELVITEDFYHDSKWAELKHLPLSLGFKGAWSMPIISSQGKVLGTFGTYFSRKRVPSIAEIEGVQILAKATALVLERKS